MSRRLGPVRRTHAGFTLLDVGVAAALLATTFVVLLALIRQSYVSTAVGARKDAARIQGQGILSALGSVPFSRLEASFGQDGHYRDAPFESRLLAGFPRSPSLQGSSTEVRFQHAPDGSSQGYLRVKVRIPDGTGHTDVVMGRGMADPSRMGRVNTGDGVNPDSLVQRAFASLRTPSALSDDTTPMDAASLDDHERQANQSAMDERNRAALTALLERMPHDPIAKLLVRAASLDAQDGKLDLDWSKFVLAEGDPRAWSRVVTALSPDRVPDGIYRARWETSSTGTALLTPEGHTATYVIYCLTAPGGREYVLLRSEEPGPTSGTPRVRMGSRDALDLGALPIKSVLTNRGPVAPADHREALAMLTDSRLFLLYDHFDQAGGADPYDTRMLIATRPEEARGLDRPGAIATSLALAEQLAGLRVGPMKR